MGDMTKNFSRHEFACNCGCGSDNISAKLVLILQEIRDHFGLPVVVNSGLRCPKYNKKVGGAKSSQHVVGNAADIRIAGISPKSVANYANKLMPGWGGIKAYPTFTHIDVRVGPWRA